MLQSIKQQKVNMNCEELNNSSTEEVPKIELALNELATMSKPEYLREIQNNRPQLLNMINVNTRFVSNVSIGYHKSNTLNVRYKPYTLLKPHRVRTKSENNDANESSTSIVQSVLDDTVRDLEDCISQLKKAKSLESICNNVDEGFVFKVPEMESVSDRIEKLKVAE